MPENFKIVYHTNEMPKLNKPYLICGMPGSGFVGKLAVDHLIHELDAKPLADIYSYSLPPQVVIRSDGMVDLMKNSMYYWSDDKKSMILLTADAQPILPDSEYLLVDQILDIVSKFDTDTVFTLAAYITGVFVDRPRVYATATDIIMLKDLKSRGFEVMESGSITGMNGVIIGLAKLRGMHGACLLGETSGYVVDAKASQAILRSLLDIIGISIDMKDLEKRAKDTEAIIRTLEQQIQAQQGGEEQQPRPRKDLGYIS